MLLVFVTCREVPTHPHPPLHLPASLRRRTPTAIRRMRSSSGWAPQQQLGTTKVTSTRRLRAASAAEAAARVLLQQQRSAEDSGAARPGPPKTTTVSHALEGGSSANSERCSFTWLSPRSSHRSSHTPLSLLCPTASPGSQGGSGGCRHDSSLGLLTKNFIALLDESGDGSLDRNTAADTLKVPREGQQHWHVSS